MSGRHLKICINLYPVRAAMSGGIATFCKWVMRVPFWSKSTHDFSAILPYNSIPSVVPLPQPEGWIKYNDLTPEENRDRPVKLPYLLRRLRAGIALAFQRAPAADLMRNSRFRRVWLKKSGFDVIHCPYQTINPMNMAEDNENFVINLHDLQHEYFPQFFTDETIEDRQKYFTLSAQTAKRIIVIAEHVKKDIVKYCNVPPERIHVIRIGPPFEGLPPVTKEERAKVKSAYNLPERFAFYPAVMWEHKNHLRLLAAYRDARKRGLESHLVFTGGKTDFTPKVLAEIERLDLGEFVHSLGFIPYSDIRVLYALADFVIAPTLYEATSGPVHEAMAMGCPVACSTVADLTEVVGDSGILFDPFNVEAITDAMTRMDANENLRSALAEKGRVRMGKRSWKSFADEYVRVYELAASGK